MQPHFEIRPAVVEDVPAILELIRELATYERAPNEVTATEEQLVEVLFGEKPVAEVLLAFEGLGEAFEVFIAHAGLGFDHRYCPNGPFGVGRVTLCPAEAAEGNG